MSCIRTTCDKLAMFVFPKFSVRTVVRQIILMVLFEVYNDIVVVSKFEMILVFGGSSFLLIFTILPFYNMGEGSG